MNQLPPDDIQEAARKVQAYLDAQERKTLTAEEIGKLSHAERLDYAAPVRPVEDAELA